MPSDPPEQVGIGHPGTGTKTGSHHAPGKEKQDRTQKKQPIQLGINAFKKPILGSKKGALDQVWLGFVFSHGWCFTSIDAIDGFFDRLLEDILAYRFRDVNGIVAGETGRTEMIVGLVHTCQHSFQG